ncbi:MAG: transporter substrate-binding domain-containing protein [Bacteroidota bacterium]
MRRRFLFLCSLYLILTNSLIANTSNDTLKIAYTRAAPFIITENGQPEGISIWLWEKIAKSLDIEYQLVEMNFGDILRGLETGNVDMSINPLTVTSGRSRRMDFTYPFYASNATVVVRQTSTFQKFLQFLSSFFSLNFLRGMIVLILVISFFGVVAWLFERKQNPEHFRRGYRGIWDGLWWSVVTMTTVGYGDKAPKSRGGKLVALVWMFAGLLFISGFTASVASTLTVNQLSWNTESINDFKTKKTGTINNSGTEDYLRHHFFKKIVPFNGLTEGLDALVKDDIDAFLYDAPILKYRLSNEIAYESLEILPVKFDLQFYAFAFSNQHNELNRQVSRKILEYTESMEWRLTLAEYDLTEL